LDLLLQLAQEDPHRDVGVSILFAFEDYLPLSEEETKQVRRQLDQCDPRLRERFEEKLVAPSIP
jgi:hypothetical protein